MPTSAVDVNAREPEQPSGRTRPARVWLLRGLLALAMAVTIAGSVALDKPVFDFVRQRATIDQQQIAGAIGRYSRGEWLLGLGATGWLAGLIFRRRDWQRRWTVVIAATALAGVLVNVPRALVGRTRPLSPEAEGWFGPRHNGHWLVGHYDYSSFPSGHAAAAAGFACATLLCFGARGWWVVPATAGVGWARVWVSAHHVSDVMAGLILGGVVGWWVWRWFVKRRWLETDIAPARAGSSAS